MVLFLSYCLLFSLLEAVSLALAGLGLAVEPMLVLISRSVCLCLPAAGIKAVPVVTGPVLIVPDSFLGEDSG